MNGTEQTTQKFIHTKILNGFLTKMQKQLNERKIVFSTNGTTAIEYPQVKKKNHYLSFTYYTKLSKNGS